MQIAENETIITVLTCGYHTCDGDEHAATVNNQKITAHTLEELIQKVIETSRAKEIQLIPHSTSCNEVNSYLLLLKADR